MENIKKTKTQIEKEFSSKILEQFLIEHQLDVDRSFSGKSLVIKKLAKPKINLYMGYVEEITDSKMDDIQIDLHMNHLESFKNKQVIVEPEDDNYYTISKNTKNVFFYDYFDLIRENLSQEKFIKFLDKKNSKDKYEENKDVIFIINYLAENQPNDLFDYLNRKSFLIKYNSVLNLVFDSYIKDQNQRLELFNTLMSIDILKDKNNQNNFYQLLNKYIENPEKNYYHFKEINESLVQNFVDASLDKTIKVNFDFLSINSFNLKNKEYTSKEHSIRIIEKGLEELNKFQAELGFNNYLFNKNIDEPAAYFTGESPNQKMIVKALDYWLENSLSENDFSNAISKELPKEVISNMHLEDILDVKQTTRNKNKI